ncbi:MAG TPA: ABC transporter permease [Gemmatimonadaceae bacterium]|nr:ABC transporter permease [Gemmatimonadaceae bacterium]
MKRSFRMSDSHSDPQRDVRAELQFHIDMRTEELIDAGMPPDEARRAAVAYFGDVDAVSTECREERVHRTRERRRREWWRGITQDTRYALRSLRRTPGAFAAALLTLALGIALTTTAFTVVNGVLLRPLPYLHPDRLAMVWLDMSGAGAPSQLPLSTGLYAELADGHPGSVAELAAFWSWGYTLQGDGEPEQIPSARVTPSLFATLGVRPLLGRTLSEEEGQPGGARSAVISYDLWQRRFGGSRSAVGTSITLSGERFTVVGVMPQGFSFPRGAELPSGFQFPARTELWAPLVFSDTDRQQYGTLNIAAVARIAPGYSAGAAQAEITGMLRRLMGELGDQDSARVAYGMVSLKDQAAQRVSRTLWVLLAAALLVLLIANVNVGMLLVARTAARRQELGVRAALGAGQGRILRQLLTENILLALGGTALGVVASIWAVRVALSLVPGSMPRADDVTVDWRVLTAAAIVAIVAGIVLGLAAAVRARRGTLAAAMRSGGMRTVGSAGRQAGRRMLVAGEVALSVMLLVGAGLLTLTFIRLGRVTPGFDAAHVLTAELGLPVPGAFNPQQDGPQWVATFEQITSRLNALPGVRSAGGVSSLPLSGAWEGGGLRVEGQELPPGSRPPTAQYNVVSGDYFKAMGIPLESGRLFTTQDRADGAGVIIVNREFVRRILNGAPPLGQQLRPYFDFSGGAPRTIIGVVGNVKQTGLDADAEPQVYVPIQQMPYPAQTLTIRAEGPPASVLPAVRGALRAVNPALALAHVRPMTDVVDDSLARQRFTMTLIATLAAAALLLSIVGLYGVLATLVGQRRREIGVRVAMGARRGDVLALILGEGVRVMVVGIALGTAAAVLASRLLASMVYGVSTTSVGVYLTAALAVGVVSVLAMWIPARRASEIHPTVVLRGE